MENIIHSIIPGRFGINTTVGKLHIEFKTIKIKSWNAKATVKKIVKAVRFWMCKYCTDRIYLI